MPGVRFFLAPLLFGSRVDSTALSAPSALPATSVDVALGPRVSEAIAEHARRATLAGDQDVPFAAHHLAVRDEAASERRVEPGAAAPHMQTAPSTILPAAEAAAVSVQAPLPESPVRAFVRSALQSGNINKIIVARKPGGAQSLPLVTQALKGAVDAKPPDKWVNVAFHVQQTGDRDVPWNFEKAKERRPQLIERFQWEIRDHHGADQQSPEYREFALALAHGSVLPRRARFEGNGQNDLEAFVADPATSVASLDPELAVKAFEMANAKGKGVMLVVEGSEVPDKLASRGDILFTRQRVAPTAGFSMAIVNAVAEVEPPAPSVDPFLSDVVLRALQSGVRHFYFAENHGQEENAAIVSQLLRTLKQSGKRYVFCRELNPMLPVPEVIQNPTRANRALASQWLTSLVSDGRSEAWQATHADNRLMEFLLSAPESKSCGLKFVSNRTDMSDFIEMGEGDDGETVYVGNFGASHVFERWAGPGLMERPWTGEQYDAPKHYQGADESLKPLWNAFERKHELAPGSVAVLYSSRLPGVMATTEETMSQHFVQGGFTTVSGPFDETARLNFVLPRTVAQSVAQLSAQGESRNITLRTPGIGNSVEADVPQDVRHVVRSVLQQGKVRKVIVGCAGTERTLPVITEALRAAVDASPADGSSRVSFYCRQLALEEGDTERMAMPGLRDLFSERLSWEIREGGEVPTSQAQEERFLMAMPASKVDLRPNIFATDTSADIAEMLADKTVSVACLSVEDAFDAFRLAEKQGAPALLLNEDLLWPRSKGGDLIEPGFSAAVVVNAAGMPPKRRQILHAAQSAKAAVPAGMARGVRDLVGTLAAQEKISKVLVARSEGALSLPLVSETVRGLLGATTSAITFHCEQDGQDVAPAGESRNPGLRDMLASRRAERYAAQVAPGSARSEITQEFVNALAHPRVVARSANFKSTAEADLTSFIADALPGTASLGLPHALQGLLMASDQNVPAMLLMEAARIPRALASREDMAFMRLPQGRSSVVVVVSASHRDLLEDFNRQQGKPGSVWSGVEPRDDL